MPRVLSAKISRRVFLLLKSNLRVKFGALRGQKNALRAPQLPAGCNVEHFSQNGFRTVLARLWARWQ